MRRLSECHRDQVAERPPLFPFDFHTPKIAPEIFPPLWGVHPIPAVTQRFDQLDARRHLSHFEVHRRPLIAQQSGLCGDHVEVHDSIRHRQTQGRSRCATSVTKTFSLGWRKSSSGCLKP
jgi:hypothetical protein